MGSERPFGSISDRILKVLGRFLVGFWSGLGRNLEGFGTLLTSSGQILEMLGMIWFR